MQKQFDAILTELLRKIDAPSSSGAFSGGDEGADSLCPVVVAVSGGVDSMTLADLCLHSKSGLRMLVAHCNFHLRGGESDGDEALVRDWCSANGVEFVSADFDTAAYARERGQSIEMAARELRYDFFARLCRERGCAAALVAHNANDNAETLILNLLRGTGMRGLCGMQPVSAVPESAASVAADASQFSETAASSADSLSSAPETAASVAADASLISETSASSIDAGSGDRLCSNSRIPLLRPLLSFTRDQIEGYARAKGLKWREDSSNSCSEYKRNRLRNEVFPLFAKINPSFVRTLNREMRLFAQANGIINTAIEDSVAELSAGGLSSCGHMQERISIPRLLSHKNWPYILYTLLEPYGFNSSTVEDIEVLLRSARTPSEGSAAAPKNSSAAPKNSPSAPKNSSVSPKGPTLSGKVFRSDRYMLVTASEDLLITALTADDGSDGSFAAVEVPGPGRYVAHFRSFNVEIIDRNEIESLKAPEGTVYMDAGKMPFPFAVRNWCPGDWLRPLGMGGRKKKVSDMFTDLKYDVLKKADALFVVKAALCEGAAEVSGTGGEGNDVPSERGAASFPEMNHVYALLGCRIDEAVKVTPATSRILRITLCQ